MKGRLRTVIFQVSLIFFVFIFPYPALATEILVTPDGLIAKFGVDILENGKISAAALQDYESWEITCGVGQPWGKWCLVSTYAIVDLGKKHECQISHQSYSANQRNLVLHELNLPAGILAFAIQLVDGSEIQVTLNFASGTAQLPLPQITGFQAVRADSVSAQERRASDLEYRIPDYSREIFPHCKFVMRGYQSLQQAKLAAFKEGLSREGLRNFESLGNNYSQCIEDRLMEFAQALHPGMCSVEEYRKLILSCIPAFGFSPGDEEKFRKYVLGSFEDMGP